MITYRIDTPRGLIDERCNGTVNGAELLDTVVELVRDPNFHPALDLLLDLTAAETFDVTVEDVRALVRTNPYFAPSRGAVVTRPGMPFGMYRMFELLNGQHGDIVEVFTDRHAAERWLVGV